MRYSYKWLTERGYDGLYDAAAQGEDSCGCHVGDLYPCDADHRDGRKCKPGVMVNNDDGSTGIGEKVKLTSTMQSAIDAAKTNNGELKRFRGGFWLPSETYNRRDGYFGAKTVEAIVSRGLGEYTEWKEGKMHTFPIRMRLK